MVRKETEEAAFARQNQKFLDASEVAALIGVSVATIRSWSSRKNGSSPKIPHIKLGQNIIRYDRDVIIDWMKAREYRPEGS